LIRDLTFILKLIEQIYCCKSALIAVTSALVYAQKDFPKALKLVGMYLVSSLLDSLLYQG
jgi:hypothetical protein